jgi:hypothetical protein
MSWGTFTVVTSTPASLEFQTDQDSGLVHSAPTTIPASDYRYPSGATWSEPDVEHASVLLRAVASEPGVTAAKVRRARRSATHRFSESQAATTVRSRLADIDARLHAGRGNDRVRVDRAREKAAGRH